MNLRSTIRKILKEETEMPTELRRRINSVNNEMDRLVSMVYTPNRICNYENAEELIEVIIYASAENLYFNTFHDMDDQSEEWGMIFQSLSNYIRDKYGDKIKEYYKYHCGD